MTEPYYANGEHLRAKHRLAHMESGRSFPHWALDLVPLHANGQYLDAGAGWGRFTWAMVDDYDIGLNQIIASDYSTGMLRTARAEAVGRGHRLNVCTADIAALPIQSRRFDGVLANHVLYHVTDLALGIDELARVLNRDGWLLATTNSDRVRVPLIELHYRALDALGIVYTPEPPSPFSMDNGAVLLQVSFRNVQVHIYEDEVIYADADQLASTYVNMGRYHNVMASDNEKLDVKDGLLPTFKQLAADLIRQEGVLHAPGLMCAFVCTEPHG